MLHAVIMAGGSGTRFWPESRAETPKQLLALLGDASMIRATRQRLEGLVPPQRMLVATTERLAEKIAAELPELPAEAILAEPLKRNTAPCIGLAAMYVSRNDPDAVMMVTPADQVIEPADAFRETVRYAAALVEDTPGRIVTFGIRPTYPAESFGYIERGEPLTPPRTMVEQPDLPPAFEVKQFREKPSAEVAAEYLASGRFFWNSGIFVWKARTILDALAKHQPLLYARLQRIAKASDTPEYAEVLRREFEAIESISIDYAVMEHADDVAMIEVPFDWDDLGSWQSLSRLLGTDEHGNTIDAKHLGLNTSGTIVRSRDGHLIVTLGLKDCIIVHTPDATLVAGKHEEEAVRNIVEMLSSRGMKEYL